jgi:excisionase family DNA binding protein
MVAVMTADTLAPATKRLRPTKLVSPPANALTLRVPDACALLGIGRTTLWRLAQQGAINPIRIGSRVLIKRSEIEALAQTGVEVA